ncbi:FAD-dependent monooxygenase [Nocardia inohanensis]|uniref:FAD-dependent monooxygenase n=1 Tax=Nocardia inohanensis TaxID=209246 RepID=UPI0008307A26|nr:FAD-dependent monooxygenase [Nocardia inohanensis]
MNVQVLIVGAGPTGLTLGIDLARRGVAVRIVDKAGKFFDGSRGDGIQPRTLEVFHDLGVLDRVFDAGCGQATMRVHIDGEFVMERRMTEWRQPTPDVPFPNPWVLGQSDTEGILRDRLAEFGVSVESGTALAEFSADADGVTAVLEHGGTRETVRAQYLVGADGGRSTVRKALGIAFEGSTDESIRMLLGDVRADALDHEFGYWFAGAGSPMDGFAMSPLPGGRKFQFAAPLTADSGAELADLQQIVNRMSNRTDIVLTELSWSTVWRPNIRLAQRFRDGRVFLAGDAAHVHPPTGGQGLNTGIQDAYNLGWKLEAALRDPSPATEALLDTYETERRAIAAQVLGLSSDLLDKTVNGDADAMNRDHALQLDLTYRNLMPPTESGDPSAVQAGDRAPDAPLTDAAGESVFLFDLLRGPHATLLVFEDTEPVSDGSNTDAEPTSRTGGVPATGDPAAPGRTLAATGADAVTTRTVNVRRAGAPGGPGSLIDTEGHAFRDYAAAPGTRVLIRPDGYIGALVR